MKRQLLLNAPRRCLLLNIEALLSDDAVLLNASYTFLVSRRDLFVRALSNFGNRTLVATMFG